MTTYPNLDLLNAQIRAARLGLPEFRSHVDSSGRNLKWLKKIVLPNPSVPASLKALLNLPQVELLKGHSEIQ